MKKILKSDSIFLLSLLTISLALTSCSKKEERTAVATPGVSGTNSGGSDGGTTGTTNGGTTSVESCSGDINDGEDDKPYDDLTSFPLHIHQIGLGGKVNWAPGNPAFRPEDEPYLSTVPRPGETISDKTACTPLECKAEDFTNRAKRSNKCYYCLKSGYAGNMYNTAFSFPIPLKKDVWPLSNNDGDIYFRLRVRSPSEFNLNNHGGSFCYGRVANDYGYFSPYAKAYTKIKVDVFARVLRKVTNCDINTNCKESDFVLTATKYPVKYGLEVDANKCSTVMRLPFSNLAQTSEDAIVLEFENVHTNAPCLEATARNNKNDKALMCPYYPLNSANCWFGTLQMATNQTHFFKGFNRATIPY